MIPFGIECLSSHYDEIFFRPDPIRSIFNQAKGNDQIRIQYPLHSANNRLRMLEYKVDAYRLLIVVLVLINGCVIAIFISVGRYGMANSNINPAHAIFNQFTLFWRKGDRSTTKILP